MAVSDSFIATADRYQELDGNSVYGIHIFNSNEPTLSNLFVKIEALSNSLWKKIILQEHIDLQNN